MGREGEERERREEGEGRSKGEEEPARP